jgi:hypothetical protein
MNSVYKRYFVLTLVALLVLVASTVNNAGVLLREIDAANAYITEHNGSSRGFEFDKLNVYVTDGEEGYYYGTHEYLGMEYEKSVTYPDYSYAGMRCSENNGEGLWLVVLVILTVLFYLYERSSATADFCAVLPVKKRGMFAVKFACLVSLAVAAMAVNIWSIYAFNARVDACNAVNTLMGIDNIDALDYNFLYLFFKLTKMLAVTSTLMLLAEVTTRVYLPVCILGLSSFAVIGALEGLVNYLAFYLKPFSDSLYSRFDSAVYFIRRMRYGTAFGSYAKGVMIWLAIAVAIALWGLYLSGRGDISRRGSVFRFRWVENTVLAGITICAPLCGYELMSLWELNYAMSAWFALLVMVVIGAAANYVARRLNLWLGR